MLRTTGPADTLMPAFVAAVAIGAAFLCFENSLVCRVVSGQLVHFFCVGLQQDRFRADEVARRGIQGREMPSVAIISPDTTPTIRRCQFQMSAAGAR